MTPEPVVEVLEVLEDEEALVLRFLPLADRLARAWHRRHPAVSVDEATSDAYLALTLAVRSFDPDRGTGTLDGWVAWKVRNGLVDGMRERLGSVVEDEDLERRRRAVRAPVGTLEEPVSRFGPEKLSVADVLPVEVLGDLDPFEIAEARVDLDSARLVLTDHERGLLVDYFTHGLPLAEIGRRRGITESGASYAVRRALVRLGRAYGVRDPRPVLGRSRSR